MSIKGAAGQYNIPRSTLGLHYRTQNHKRKLGRSPVLSAAQENDLVVRIHRLAEQTTYQIHFPKCRIELVENGSGYSCPDVSRRRAQQMNMARAQKMNKPIVDDYFHKLRETIQKLKLFDKPGNIYNIDEKGCRLTIHKQQIVLSKKGAKRVHLTAPEHEENVSIVGCGNALGQSVPPFVLFKGQRLKPEWSDHLPPGSKAIVTNKGSMTCEAFVLWLDHFSSFKNSDPTLLIFDGAKSHLDISIVNAADRMGITLICLPSNTSHELQPMDKAVFRSFETFWDQEVLQFLTINPGKAITKMRFGEIFTPVWLKAMTPSNIISGFTATGIYPFRPEAIPEAAFAPSLITRREDEEVNHSNSEDVFDVASSSKLIKSTDKNKASTSGYQVTKKTNSKKREDEVNHSNSQDLQDVVGSSSKLVKPANINNASTSGYQMPNKTVSMKKRVFVSLSDSESLSDFSLHDDLLDDISSEDEPLISLKKKSVVMLERSNQNKKFEVKTMRRYASSDEDKNPITKLKDKQKDNTVTKESTRSNLRPNQIMISTADSKFLDNSFKDTGLLMTPEIKAPTVKRKPALNSKAQQVTKDLFVSKSKLSSTKANRKEKKSTKKKSKKESWFCFLCNTCSEEDMRLCIVCGRYVHEACVGLTKDDKENFICPQCS